MAFERRRAHRAGVDFDAGHQVGENRERVGERVDAVEQRFLVLLVVLVVGERLRFHQQQQCHQVAGDAAALAARELGHVRIFLLRHDRGAGAEAVGQADEAVARAHPQHQFLRQARDVSHDERGRGAELDGEVAIRHRVERIRADAVETQRFRHHRAIDRIGGAGERGRAQRQAVHALAAVGEPFAVAREHLEIGHQVVAEGHRLRHLQMGEAGHHRAGVALGLVEQAPLQPGQLGAERVDRIAQPQAHVGRHLVVARARRVQALAGVARKRGQAAFDIEVHVLSRERPFELAAAHFRQDGAHAGFDRGEVAPGDHRARREHARVRERAADVVFGQALIEGNRGGIALHRFCDRLGEASRPGGAGRRLLVRVLAHCLECGQNRKNGRFRARMYAN